MHAAVTGPEPQGGPGDMDNLDENCRGAAASHAGLRKVVFVKLCLQTHFYSQSSEPPFERRGAATTAFSSFSGRVTRGRHTVVPANEVTFDYDSAMRFSP
jgi:hypothetical protein